MTYELIKGEPYKIKGDVSPHENFYVMHQFLPKTKKEWATFFNILGKENWMILRTRIPKDSITGIEKNVIASSGFLSRTLVWPDEPDRKPLVEKWLNEVKNILEKTNYTKTDSFREYFG